jgi:cyclin T
MQQPAVNGSSYPQPGYRPASAAQLPPAVAAKPAATQKQADQTRNMWQFMSNAELTKNSPSLKDGIDEKRQMYFRSSYCEFLKEAGMSMKFPQLTIATAVVFCHRYFSRHSFSNKANDIKIIATACLFLAGKVEETPRSLSEMVQKTYLIRHRRREDKEADRDAILERIKRKEVYEAEKDKILVAERGVLHALEFCFNVEHAYKTVLLTVKREARNDKEIAQVAWNFCNDSLRTLLSLQYEAPKIAVAVVHLASKFLNNEIQSEPSAGPWWKRNGVAQAELEDISNQILDLYQILDGKTASGTQVSTTSGDRAKSAQPASSAAATSTVQPSPTISTSNPYETAAPSTTSQPPPAAAALPADAAADTAVKLEAGAEAAPAQGASNGAAVPSVSVKRERSLGAEDDATNPKTLRAT